MLLVLGHVAGDGLVAELGQLDPHLFGGHLVRPATHHGPVAPGRREAIGRLGDRGPPSQHLGERVGQLAKIGEQPVAGDGIARAEPFGQGAGQESARGHLGVERLGRGHRHLHVPPVGGVEDAVCLVGEVAVAAVHDADDGRATLARQIDGAVGVGGGAALADRHDQGVAQVRGHAVAGELGGRRRLDTEVRPTHQAAQDGGHALARDGRGALADHQHAGDRAGGEPFGHILGERPLAELGSQEAVALTDAAPQGLAEAARCLGDLLQQEVRVGAAVDVAGGDLGDLLVVGAEGQLGAVVGEAADALQLTRVAARRARRPGHGCPAGQPAGASRRRFARTGASPRPARRARTPR